MCTKSVLNPYASCSVHEMYHDLSMLVFCFRGHTFLDNCIYELQKSPTIAFSRNSLYTFYSRNPTCRIHQCLRISNHKYPPPPCPQNSIIVNYPSPSEIVKAVRGMVWIFSGIAHYKFGMGELRTSKSNFLQLSTSLKSTMTQCQVLNPQYTILISLRASSLGGGGREGERGESLQRCLRNLNAAPNTHCGSLLS